MGPRIVIVIKLNSLQYWNLRQAKANRHRHAISIEFTEKTAEFLRSAHWFNMKL